MSAAPQQKGGPRPGPVGKPITRPTVAANPAVRRPVGHPAPTRAGQPPMAKKPVNGDIVNDVDPTDAPAAKRAKLSTTLVVYNKAVSDELGMETLVGEYTEAGSNHGRKAYRRTKTPEGGDQELSVFIYYWDNRDGPDFAGWWFGDQIGGTQVWSRCDKADPQPPKSGWRIPWDGEVQPDLVCEPKPEGEVKEEGQDAKVEGSDLSAAAQAEVDERVQRATDRVVIAEVEATQALENVKAMLEGEVTDDNLKDVKELLQEQGMALTQANKVLAADIIDARKTCPKAVAALNKLSPRVRSVQASVAQEIKNSQHAMAKKKQAEVDAKQRAIDEEKTRQKEQNDAKALEEALPLAIEAVNQLEELFDSVVAAAGPVVSEMADEANDFTAAAIRETEAAVVKAQGGIKAARTQLNQSIATAKEFAPEARKVALSEYNALQDKVNDLQKRITPFVRIRKDFEQRLESKRVMAEVSKHVAESETEVEKIVNGLSSSTPTEDEVRSSEALVPPALERVATTIALVEQKMESAPKELKDELNHMKERGNECNKRLEDFKLKLYSLMEGLQLETIMREANEKVQATEDALVKATEAEAPLIKGVDVVPANEATEAVNACRAASASTHACARDADSFIKAKTVVVKCFPDHICGSSVGDLAKLQERVEHVLRKMEVFDRETNEREITIMLQETSYKVADVESRMKRMIEIVAPLQGDIVSKDVSAIRESAEQALELEKSIAMLCADSRKSLMAKVKEGKSKESSTFTAELSKLQSRLNASQQELAKQRKLALQGEKIWKGKVLLEEKSKEMKELEDEVEKAEILTTPLGDENPTDEHIRSMDEAVTSVQKKLDEMTKSLEPVQSMTGAIKDHGLELVERAKKAQSRLDEMKETTREQRERVFCEAAVNYVRGKVTVMEQSFTKIVDAEVPYLKGIEVLPLDEATQAHADSEVAISSVHHAIGEAKKAINEKVKVVKTLLPVISAAGLKDMEAIYKEVVIGAERLVSFKKDTEVRKQAMLHQQAVANVEEAEVAVGKVKECVTAFDDQVGFEETFSREDAQERLEKFGAAERTANEKLDTVLQFLSTRQRELRQDTKATAALAEMSKLVGRISNLKVEMSNAKTVATEHEQKFVSTMLITEAKSMIESLETELEAAAEAAGPLLGDGGKRFVVASMAKQIIEALQEHAAKESSTMEDIFKQMMPDAKGNVSRDKVIAFLDRVPDMIARPDLQFTQESREMIFTHMDSKGSGSLSKADFLNLCHDKYVCIHSIAITDSFDIATGKNIAFLEVDDVVETLCDPRTHETLGMMRVEIRTQKDGTTGWVTMQGNQGKVYLNLHTPYAAFNQGLEKIFGSAKRSATKASEHFMSKCKELARCEKGPLAEAKTQLAAMRPKILALSGKLDVLRKRVDEGRREHSKREEDERRKQEEKKDKKAAAEVLRVIDEKVELVESCLQKLTDAAAPLSTDVSSTADPIAALEAVKAAFAALEPKITEGRSCLVAHEGKIAKATRGPWFEAKQEMKALKQRVDSADKKAKELMKVAKGACETFAETKRGQVAVAFRQHMQSKGLSTDALFKSMADKSGRITQKKLFAQIAKLPGIKIDEAHQRLLLKKDAAAGLSRRDFCELIERYFRCVKEIAITSKFDIKDSSTLRKLEIGELVEVVEGPETDATLGVTRLHARSLVDGAQGWVTATGNHGTPFLVEIPKPSFRVCQEVSLTADFPSEGSKEVASLKPHEVVEILEGPRVEQLGNAMRARGKALSDGATGWFTYTSKGGTELVAPGQSNYTCVSSIALTDSIDIKDSKVLRKLSKGETLSLLEGPTTDDKAGVARIRVRANQDSSEGWVTVKGNAGSVFVQETGRQVVTKKRMLLEDKFECDAGEVVRALEENEKIQILSGPKEEKPMALKRIRVRVLSSGKEGWLTQSRSLAPWTPLYKCVTAFELHEARKPSQAVRSVDVGEQLEHLDGPVWEDGVGAFRIRVRALTDELIGWATIATPEGTTLLENVPSA